jgi:hypothetical protein
MPTEYIISDSIVACVTIDAPPQRTTKPGAESKFRSLCEKLPTMCSPKEDVKFFEGRAYDPFYANNFDPEAGCSWTDTTSFAESSAYADRHDILATPKQGSVGCFGGQGLLRHREPP